MSGSGTVVPHDNPLQCSECGSPGVYKAGMCDGCYGRKDNPRKIGFRKWKQRGYRSGTREALNDLRDGKPRDDVAAKRRIIDSLPADISHDNLNEWHDGFDLAYNGVYFLEEKHPFVKDNPSDTISHRDIYEFNLYLKNCSDSQVQEVYEKERAAGRTAYATLAKMEADRRGLSVSRRDNPDVDKPWKGEFPIDRPEDMDDTARKILLSNLRAGRRGFPVGSRVQTTMGARSKGTVVTPGEFYSTHAFGGPETPLAKREAIFVRWDDGSVSWVHSPVLSIIRSDNPAIKHDTDTKQYYHVRIRPPKRGEEFRTIEFKPSVKAVIGIHAKKGPRGGRSDIQKLLFDKDRFTVNEIKSWLKENGFGKLK